MYPYSSVLYTYYLQVLVGYSHTLHPYQGMYQRVLTAVAVSMCSYLKLHVVYVHEVNSYEDSNLLLIAKYKFKLKGTSRPTSSHIG